MSKLNEIADKLEKKHIIESAKGSEESKEILSLIQYYRINEIKTTYCGEQGEENMKSDLKEIMHACGEKIYFTMLCNQVQNELDEAAFDLDQESRMNGV